MRLIKNDNQIKVQDKVISILTGPDDDDGYDADHVESRRLTEKLIELIVDLNEGDADEGNIAEFVYDYMKWRL